MSMVMAPCSAPVNGEQPHHRQAAAAQTLSRPAAQPTAGRALNTASPAGYAAAAVASSKRAPANDRAQPSFQLPENESIPEGRGSGPYGQRPVAGPSAPVMPRSSASTSSTDISARSLGQPQSAHGQYGSFAGDCRSCSMLVANDRPCNSFGRPL